MTSKNPQKCSAVCASPFFCYVCKRCRAHSKIAKDGTSCVCYACYSESWKIETEIVSLKETQLRLEQKVAALQLRSGELETENNDLRMKGAGLEERNKGIQSTMLQIGTDKLLVRKFVNLVMSATIPIFIGPSQTKFVIHAGAICHKSAHLEELISTKQSSNETVVLDGGEYNIEAFKMFVEYCYFGTYFGAEHDKSELLLHARVYALANKLKCRELKAVALRKATEWCYGDYTQPGGSRLSDMFPDMLDAINVVYTYTVDPESGFLPRTPNSPHVGGKPGIIRDGFRLLLAKLAAMNLSALKKQKRFLKVHHQFREFNTDMLLFLTGNKGIISLFPTNEPPAFVQLRKDEISAFSRLFNNDTLAVFVGEDSKRFDVHKSAVQCSEYFRRLMTSEMIESRGKAVYLTSEVDTPDAFNKFVQYCYLQDYLCDEDRVDSFAQHAAVYALAERLVCPILKCLALEKAKGVCDAAYPGKADEVLVVTPAVVALIYENTYDNHSAKLIGTPSESKEDGTSELSSSVELAVEKCEKGQHGMKEAAAGEIVVASKDIARDGFRMLLARFASVYISRLREQALFIAAHHAFPDFATDLMLLAMPDEGFQLGKDGQLKLEA
ncbi:uncharacterized protein DFL_000413 [Arthrobotrys flagrans]|uniref:BTB domain-containing protein n=1 Tax=Arthrobotrys flagrans TaxID=97331 RepID=A0A437ADS8_ARTFL|nr:hypothetical protein DFL_000413 [Arthrobotrys flagrans]